MDLYVILGLTREASVSEIKRAYRRLARRFHPDINPGDRTAEVRFRQILDAYETLIDPDRRARYEAGDAAAAPAAHRRSGFEGFDFTNRGTDHSATFGDLFAEVLSERDGAQAAQLRGADLHQDLSLTFAESFTGAVRTIAVTRRVTCRGCAGSRVTQAHQRPCLVCHGGGVVQSVRGHMVFSRRCTSCDGAGQQRPRACGECSGTGQETRAEQVRVHIPAGIADGDQLRLEGKGNAGGRGGHAGDLYLTLRVAPDGRFRREGADLHLSVPIAVHEAGLGARIDVPAPDGMVRVTIPPGTQSGRRLRVRERGMPSAGGRGDLIIEVRVVLPDVLDERSKELLREFGRLNAANVRDEAQAPADSAAGADAAARDAGSRAPSAERSGRQDGEAR
jgi:molecular chaperone DnaJ